MMVLAIMNNFTEIIALVAVGFGGYVAGRKIERRKHQ